MSPTPLRTIELSHFGDPALSLADLSFDRVLFDNCALLRPSHPSRRSYLRRISVRGCQQRACLIAGAAIEDTVVHNLSRLGDMPLFLSGVVFRHVVLSGRISLFKLNLAPTLQPDPRERMLWLTANRTYYSETDWALDISRAEFTFGPDLHFVPGSLIRRDAATQALVRRSAVAGVNLSGLPWGESALEIALSWFIQDGPYEDVVLVAPKGSKSHERDLAAITMLRERGLAEPA